MAGETRITYKFGVTSEQISTLMGWPELEGFVVIGLPRDLDDMEIKMACDTSDLNQAEKLIAAVLTPAPQGSNQ